MDTKTFHSQNFKEIPHFNNFAIYRTIQNKSLANSITLHSNLEFGHPKLSTNCHSYTCNLIHSYRCTYSCDSNIIFSQFRLHSKRHTSSIPILTEVSYKEPYDNGKVCERQKENETKKRKKNTYTQ